MKRFVKEYANYTKKVNKGWIVEFHGGAGVYGEYCKTIDNCVAGYERGICTADEAVRYIADCYKMVRYL